MKYFTFVLPLILLFAGSLYSKTYTLRIVENEFSSLHLSPEIKAENINLPYPLTPRQYENIDSDHAEEFQINLPLNENICVFDASSLNKDGKIWLREKSREISLGKITDDKFSLKIKIAETCESKDAESKLEEDDEGSGISASANLAISLNTPTLVALAKKTSVRDESTFILGDIPLIGRLFSSKKQNSSYLFIMAILTENEDGGARQ